ncbi:MAG: hypothetical protein CM15mP93_06030 [Thiotrichaceae bacterium]|nr:MAG: hypothetical protein CM15mP93_06030 [Thiotrichaceae bacterium]
MPSPLLPRALIIPDVTVWPIPKGFPIATTKSPTLRSLEFAIFKDLSFLH